MEYFSQVPYRFGPGRAVKYSAKPSSPPPVLDVTGTLADALAKHLSMQGATFDFQVQLQTDPVTMPIEDSTVEWPEDPASKGSPFTTVATIRIEKGPVRNCESMAFDPWHHVEDHGTSWHHQQNQSSRFTEPRQKDVCRQKHRTSSRP